MERIDRTEKDAELPGCGMKLSVTLSFPSQPCRAQVNCPCHDCHQPEDQGEPEEILQGKLLFPYFIRLLYFTLNTSHDFYYYLLETNEINLYLVT